MKSTFPAGLAATESGSVQTQPLRLLTQRVGVLWLSEQGQKWPSSYVIFKPEEEAYPGADLLNIGLCPSCLPTYASGTRRIPQPLVYASVKWVLSADERSCMNFLPHLIVGKSALPYAGAGSQIPRERVCDLKTHVVYLFQSLMCFCKCIFVPLRGVLTLSGQSRQLPGYTVSSDTQAGLLLFRCKLDHLRGPLCIHPRNLC